MAPALAPTLRNTLLVAAALVAGAGLAEATGAPATATFALSALALASLAAVVGEAIDAIGERVGPGGTGMLQSSVGNLPEALVGIFALRRGLVQVVQAALVGSMLANLLLVAGVAFFAGGLRNGTQRFDPEEPRLYGSLLLVAVGALVVPTLAHHLDTPAAHHGRALSEIDAVVLLALYAGSVVYLLRSGDGRKDSATRAERRLPTAHSVPTRDGGVPLLAAIGVLVAAGAGAAVVSDWFVGTLEPATRALGISPVFTGLVIVAIASNAVENAVSVRFALRAEPAYALATTLASPLQIALLLTPVLVLVSGAVGPTPLTLVFPPLLVAALAVGTLVMVVVVYDGEYTWIEGIALVGLYAMVAAAFWWG
jgi:Ca2+:H+ antiporter